MMQKLLCFLGIYGVVLAGAGESRAADDPDKFYFHADVGSSLVQDVNIVGFQFASFRPGIRGDVSLGCQLNQSWSVELETGLIWNSVTELNGSSRSGRGGGTNFPGIGPLIIFANGDLYQIPLLANVNYHLSLKRGWISRFGAGAGGVASVLELYSPRNAQMVRGADADFTFAYQAETGVSYVITPRAAVDLDYKFFGTLDHHWNYGGKLLSSGPIFTHAFLLSFRWEF